jgi:penicillin-binding protein 2
VRLHHFIPSMFQRRLLFLMLAMAACTIFPILQMSRLTLAKGDELRTDAQKRLVNEAWMETSRGRILDRKGRELAIDRPSLDIAVDYNVITGRWADQKAGRAARKAADAGGRNWVTMSQEERDVAIAAAREPFESHLKAMWTLFAQTAGISVEQLDTRKREIIEQVQYGAALAIEQKRKKEADKWRAAGKSGSPPADAVHVTIQEEREAHVILRGVPDEIGFAFDRLKDMTNADEDTGISKGKPLPIMPGLHVVDSARREYPYDTLSIDVDTSSFPPPLRGGIKSIRVPGVAMHLLGRMRSKLYKEDMDRRPQTDPTTGKTDRGYYRPGDATGQGGVEQAKEDVLRGLRGVRQTHLDTGVEQVEDRQPGQDVPLTIDAQLQARIQALFDPSLGLAMIQPWQRKTEDDAPRPDAPKPLPLGTPLNGAVVVIDVASGDVLSMVSMPSYSHEQADTMQETIPRDEFNNAFVNRAIGRVYPPGSIVKPLVLCEAIREGKYSPQELIACTGHFFQDKPLLYRCWIYKQFHTTHSAKLGHDLDGADGIKCSCNIFFFEMGKRLGPQGMHDVFTTYGVGRDAEPFNIFGLPPLPGDRDARTKEQQRRGLLNEAMGEVRSPDKCSSQEAILTGIGQGPVTWTPLHAANAYAAIARRGVLITPRIYADAEQERKDLGIPGAAITQALKGLHGSANEENGTTHTITYPMPDGSKKIENVFTAPGIAMWAKSGTADTNPFTADLSQEDGRDELYDSDHAWCVCLAGVGEEPRYAIACVLESGGSGGKVSGPLANQVVYALIAEGYLPDLRGTVADKKRKGESN